jgi:hypothetical protein
LFDGYNTPSVPEFQPPTLPLEVAPIGWFADFRNIGHQDGVTITNAGNVPVIRTDPVAGLSIQARQIAYVDCPVQAGAFDTQFVVSCNRDFYFRFGSDPAAHGKYKFSLYFQVMLGQVQLVTNENGTNATRWSYVYPSNAFSKPTYVRVVCDRYAQGFRVAIGIEPQGQARIWKTFVTMVNAPWLTSWTNQFFYYYQNVATVDAALPLKLQYWKVRQR